MQFPVSELVLDKLGRVYHLGLKPENISDTILLVGDQDRVKLVSSFFDTIEFEHQHREFVTHTGVYKGKRISVISTGIGTDNIDIVINELDALANINLESRDELPTKKQLSFIRIGTCGILQPTIPVHSFILSKYALGLDNVAHFYEIPFSTEEEQLCEQLTAHIELPNKIQPYLVKASDSLISKLSSNLTFQGITVTSSGFYGPQGRQLLLKTKTTQLNEKLTSFESTDVKVTNFEMESSALFALGKTLGHQCATICLGIANRPNMEFSKGYDAEMNELIEYVLTRI